MIPFNTRKSAAEYIYMADGYDGCAIVQVLNSYLDPGSTVLELGMGPGKDIELLEQKYTVAGSDISQAFVDLYLEKRPGSDVLILDAVTLETNRMFDCIYSNKVFHYLDANQLKKSFRRQFEVLNPGGILCHTFWYGQKMIEVNGMHFHYYTELSVRDCLSDPFDVLLAKTYREMDTDDSLLMLLRKG